MRSQELMSLIDDIKEEVKKHSATRLTENANKAEILLGGLRTIVALDRQVVEGKTREAEQLKENMAQHAQIRALGAQLQKLRS